MILMEIIIKQILEVKYSLTLKIPISIEYHLQVYWNFTLSIPIGPSAYYKGSAKATQILLMNMTSIKTDCYNFSDAGSTPASSTK